MSKIIYSKYSNERDDRFKIRTSILQDELGNKKVKKTPLSKESNEHVKNIIWIINCYQNSMKDPKYQSIDVVWRKIV